MAPEKQRKILVTAALPYANNELHLGHVLEHVQTDIWVRFQKMCGHQCIAVCGDDAHGTSVMLAAQKRNITPEAMIVQVHQKRLDYLGRFLIDFDHYHTTHSEENRVLSGEIYRRLKAGGHIISREVSRLFDSEKNMFLADRYVRGDCPACGAGQQYGDNCEVCGATYSASELGNPRSVLTGTVPVEKASEHLFFRVSDFAPVLESWVQGGAVAPEIANKLNEWFSQGLKDWDISRDAPYFGFEIQDEPGKYFYVWLDAPVGYMAAFRYL